MLLIAIFTAILSGSPLVSGPLPTDEKTVAFVDAVVADTTQEWTKAFQERRLVYVAPRVIYLRMPTGHPGRGSGYRSNVGLVIDLNDINGLRQILRADGADMPAFIVAHEIGHHVQHLSARDGAGALVPAGEGRELQADCYAGWSLRHSPYRSGLEEAPGDGGLEVRLSKALQVLDALDSGGFPLRRNAPSTASHGSLQDRIEAIRAGLTATQPWDCESGHLVK